MGFGKFLPKHGATGRRMEQRAGEGRICNFVTLTYCTKRKDKQREGKHNRLEGFASPQRQESFSSPHTMWDRQSPYQGPDKNRIEGQEFPHVTGWSFPV